MHGYGAVLAVLALLSYGCENGARVAAPEIRVFENPRTLAPVRLIDHFGQKFDADRLLGRWTFLTFGFTSCPEICPTMLFNLAKLQQALDPAWSGAASQFVFVSVDPQRDKIEVLAQYVPAFAPQFIGATGTQEAVDRMHQDFGGTHRLNRPQSGNPGYYTVDHSVLLYVIDPNGRLYAEVTPPFDAAALAQRMTRIARDYTDRKAFATSAAAGRS